MNELVGGLGYAVKNWWMSLLLGLLYIAVALCLLFAPVSSYVALSVIFSISILVSGILEIFFAVGNKKIINSWGWYLAGGIIDLLITRVRDKDCVKNRVKRAKIVRFTLC